jgi:UDP-3-O-[3-hydroxymyristoyl] N-acetylglucosamine deacetylase
VDHLRLRQSGVDNVIVELNSPEVPIMDGSAAPFIYLIQEAGVKKLQAPRKYLKIVRPIMISRGDKRIALYPSEHFKVTYSISYDHPLLRHQSRTLRITGVVHRGTGARPYLHLPGTWLRRTAWPSGGRSRTRSFSAKQVC